MEDVCFNDLQIEIKKDEMINYVNKILDLFNLNDDSLKIMLEYLGCFYLDETEHIESFCNFTKIYNILYPSSNYEEVTFETNEPPLEELKRSTKNFKFIKIYLNYEHYLNNFSSGEVKKITKKCIIENGLIKNS